MDNSNAHMVVQLAVNLRRKAWKHERQCQLDLEAEGYVTEKMQYSGNQYQKRKDFFGLWDVMALKPDMIKFIQVKTNHKPVLHEYREFARNYPNIQCEIWIWYEQGKSVKHLGWRKIVLKVNDQTSGALAEEKSI